MSTQNRLKKIQKMIKMGIIFEIYSFTKVDDNIYFKISKFDGYDKDLNMVFPSSKTINGGSSFSESSTSIENASKKILKLIRDFHDIEIEHVWNVILSMPKYKRKNHHIVIRWNIDVDQYQYWGGTIFCDNLDEMKRINDKFDKENQEKERSLHEAYLYLVKEIETYKQSRKEKGLWDNDIYL